MTHRSQAPWIHLAGTSVLLAVVQVVVLQIAGADRRLWLGLPAFVYGVLPMVTAVSALWIAPGMGRTRGRMVLVAISGMLLLDAASEPRLISLGDQTQVYRTHTQQGPNPSSLARVSAVGTAVDWLAGRVPDARVRLSPYPPGHGRVRVAFAIQKGALLLMPWLLMGVVLGAVQWLRHNVTFVDPRRARFVVVGLAWCLAGMVQLVVSWAANQALTSALSDGPLPAILAPHVFLGALSFAGWKSLRTEPATTGVFERGVHKGVAE